MLSQRISDKQTFKIRQSHACLVVAVLLVLPLVAVAQTSATAVVSRSLSISSQRPLLEALEAVASAVSAPISFEDIPYENAGDLLQVKMGKTGIMRVTPRGGTFGTSVNAGDSAEMAVQSVLAAYYNAALPGTFEVVRRDDGVDVLPVSLTGSDGSEKKVVPIMNRPVSFPTEERSVTATFQTLVDALSSASGKRILLGNVPFPDNLKITIGATNEPATSLISKISSSLRPTSFLLLFEPNDKAYYLTLTLTPFPPPAQVPSHPTSAAPSVNPFFVKTPSQP